MPDYNDYFHQRYFAGCRWIFNPFTEGYAEIRNFLAPREFRIFSVHDHRSTIKIFLVFAAFFVAVQFFYTLGFIGMLVAAVLIVMYLLCASDENRVKVLRWTGIDLLLSGTKSHFRIRYSNKSITLHTARFPWHRGHSDLRHNGRQRRVHA